MKRTLSLGLALASLALASCATGIAVRVEKPAEIDLAGIKRITVIPFGYAGDGADGSRLGDALSRATSRLRYRADEDRQAAVAVANGMDGILRASGAFSIVKASALAASMERGGDPSSAVDAFIAGEVAVTKCKEASWRESVTNRDGSASEVAYVDRELAFEFAYRFVRVVDGSILAQETFSGSANYRGPRASAKSAYDLAQEIIGPALPVIARRIAPHAVTERRYLEEDESGDPRMKAAARLAAKGKYSEALAAYDEVYAESGGRAAGYNAAIVLELLGDLDGAIARMSALAGGEGGEKAAAEVARMEKSKADAERLEASGR